MLVSHLEKDSHPFNYINYDPSLKQKLLNKILFKLSIKKYIYIVSYCFRLKKTVSMVHIMIVQKGAVY